MQSDMLGLQGRMQGINYGYDYLSRVYQDNLTALHNMPAWDVSWEVTPLYLHTGWWLMTVPSLYDGRCFSVHESALPFEEVQRLLRLHNQARIPMTYVAPEHLPVPMPLSVTFEQGQVRENERVQHLRVTYDKALINHLEIIRNTGKFTEEQLEEYRIYQVDQYNLQECYHLPMELIPVDIAMGWWYMRSETMFMGRGFAVHESMLHPANLASTHTHFNVVRAPMMFMYPCHLQHAPLSLVETWTAETESRLEQYVVAHSGILEPSDVVVKQEEVVYTPEANEVNITSD
jgi:hypothetical protein